MKEIKRLSKEENVVKKELVIKNELGLHARPASLFVQLANKFSSDIRLQKGAEEVSGKSIMGVLMLAVGKGGKIKIIAKGPDAQEAVKELEELVNSKFGED